MDAILGYEFESNAEPFAVDVLVESMFAFGFELANIYVKGKNSRMIYMVCLGVAGMLMNFTTYTFNFKQPFIKTSEIFK